MFAPSPNVCQQFSTNNHHENQNQTNSRVKVDTENETDNDSPEIVAPQKMYKVPEDVSNQRIAKVHGHQEAAQKKPTDPLEALFSIMKGSNNLTFNQGAGLGVLGLKTAAPRKIKTAICGQFPGVFSMVTEEEEDPDKHQAANGLVVKVPNVAMPPTEDMLSDVEHDRQEVEDEQLSLANLFTHSLQVMEFDGILSTSVATKHGWHARLFKDYQLQLTIRKPSTSHSNNTGLSKASTLAMIDIYSNDDGGYECLGNCSQLNHIKFPIVALMAWDYLASSGSLAQPECTFSAATHEHLTRAKFPAVISPLGSLQWQQGVTGM
ncbi:hypothetical protein DFH28DRAFT_1103573 [Melampsora americana]|nr:hypothetical protein DFH28DRAFT_1103573 [Melampsora americana]